MSERLSFVLLPVHFCIGYKVATLTYMYKVLVHNQLIRFWYIINAMSQSSTDFLYSSCL